MGNIHSSGRGGEFFRPRPSGEREEEECRRGACHPAVGCEMGISHQDHTIGVIAILDENAVRVWPACAVIRDEGPTDDVEELAFRWLLATGYGR